MHPTRSIVSASQAQVERAVCEVVSRALPPLTYSCPRPIDTNGDGKADKCLPRAPGGEADTFETVQQIRRLNAALAALSHSGRCPDLPQTKIYKAVSGISWPKAEPAKTDLYQGFGPK